MVVELQSIRKRGLGRVRASLDRFRSGFYLSGSRIWAAIKPNRPERVQSSPFRFPPSLDPLL